MSRPAHPYDPGPMPTPGELRALIEAKRAGAAPPGLLRMRLAQAHHVLDEAELLAAGRAAVLYVQGPDGVVGYRRLSEPPGTCHPLPGRG